MDLGKNLLSLCEKNQLSLAELARRSGVPQPTLHGWTTGKSVQNLGDLKKVCEVLKTGLHEVLFGEKDPFERGGSLRIEEVFQKSFMVTIKAIEKV